MYLSILILPLLGSLVSGLLGRKLGVTGAHIITCTCLILSSILATIAFYEVGICGSPVSVYLVNWVDSEFMSISWEFLFDQLTVSMYIPILYISSLIHIFSTDYMSEDPHNQRFFSYLSLFTFFMLLLVSGANFFVMFVGWEGIGIVSYLLINFWFTRIQANKAAILALTMNRVGDMGLSIGFFAIFALVGSIDYATVFSLAPFVNESAITIIGLLLLTGAMAKSAQIPLHSWLPGSMEGPTPVSALIHAATLVTAGLYLLVRCSPLLEYSSTALLVITLVGASTAFFAATCGLVQNDLKRIIAFSTISQLGYIILLHLIVYLYTYDPVISILCFYFYIDIYIFIPNFNNFILLSIPSMVKNRKLIGLIILISFRGLCVCWLGSDVTCPVHFSGPLGREDGNNAYNLFPDIDNLIEENAAKKEEVNQILVNHFYLLCTSTSATFPDTVNNIIFELVPYADNVVLDLTQSTIPFSYRSPSTHLIEQLGPFETNDYSMPLDINNLNKKLKRLSQGFILNFIDDVCEYIFSWI